MANPVQVIAVIDPATGDTSYEVEGAVGGACTDITAALTANKKVLEQDLKCEFYTPAERPDYIDGGGSAEE